MHGMFVFLVTFTCNVEMVVRKEKFYFIMYIVTHNYVHAHNPALIKQLSEVIVQLLVIIVSSFMHKRYLHQYNYAIEVYSLTLM